VTSSAGSSITRGCAPSGAYPGTAASAVLRLASRVLGLSQEPVSIVAKRAFGDINASSLSWKLSAYQLKRSMMNLRKVPYDSNSDIPAVQACLRRKREVARRNGGVNGIGPISCCSYIEYENGGRIDNVFGNSRVRVPYGVSGSDVKIAAVHAEMVALWQLYEDFKDGLPRINAFYIELEPCEALCKPALLNMLRADQEVMYSFSHPDEMRIWEGQARSLCRGT